MRAVWAYSVFLWMLLPHSGEARGALRSSPAPSVEACRPEQVKTLFPEPEQSTPELRVLVTSFLGLDDSSRMLGLHVGSRMREAVESYARAEIKPEHTGLYNSSVRVKFIPCTVDDHESARKLGQSAHVDAVMWGKAFCHAQNPRACQTVTINVNSNNVIQSSPNASMMSRSGPIKIQTPDPLTAGRFTTSLTVVRWPGLEGNASSGPPVRRLDQVAALGLPRLVSEQPRLLLDLVMGLFASRAKRYGLASVFFERAKKDVTVGVDGAAELYRMIGTSYLVAGWNEQGLATLEAALRLCVSSDLACEAATLHNQGWAKSRLGDKRTALSYYERALPLRQAVGDVSGEAMTLSNIGSIHSAQGDRRTALSYYQRALPLQQKVGDVPGEATTLNNIGFIYDSLGDETTSLSYYARALPLRQKVGDVFGEATTLNNIGAVHSSLGDKKTALTYYERALPLRQKAGDASGEAVTLHNIGGVYSSLGDKKTALAYYERALLLRQKVGDVSGEGFTRDRMALVLRDLGRVPEAIHSLREASACQLRRLPPNTEKAIGSLSVALSLAMRAGVEAEMHALSAQLDTLDPDEIRKLLRQARIAGLMKSLAAESYYKRISTLANELPPVQQAKLRIIAQAGLTRAQHRAAWPDCPGVLITQVVPASQAKVLGLRVGDIALRYQGVCLFEPTDLSSEESRTTPSQTVTLELWRDDTTQTLTAQGGVMGFVVESI